jgi:hypothetical protein
MTHTTRLLTRLLRLVLPAGGRHRAAVPRPVSPPVRAVPDRPTLVLRGEDIGLVRPYVIAHERRQEARRQRLRRRSLWLAVHGVDIGPRLIHGVEVSA